MAGLTHTVLCYTSLCAGNSSYPSTGTIHPQPVSSSPPAAWQSQEGHFPGPPAHPIPQVWGFSWLGFCGGSLSQSTHHRGGFEVVPLLETLFTQSISRTPVVNNRAPLYFQPCVSRQATMSQLSLHPQVSIS